MEIGSSEEGRGDSNPGSGNSFVNVTSQKADGGTFQEERDLAPLMTEPPRTVEGIELVYSRRQQEVSYRSIETTQIQLMEWWKSRVDLSQRIGDWAVHIFTEL